MKVLFDHQTFTLQEFGGISRYFFEIFKRFRAYKGMDVRSSLLLSNNEYLQAENVMSHVPFFPAHTFKGKRRIMLAVNEAYSRMRIATNNFDIFHPTYYDPYHFKLNAKKPWVVTCLDLIHEKYIQDDVVTIRNKKRCFERADYIFAISRNTKNDLVERYNINPDKIVVTYLASSMTIQKASDIPAPKEPFLLYVGARNLYKNFIPFLTAIKPLLERDKNLMLYCAGGGKFTADELNAMTTLSIANRVVQKPGSDDSLRNLYKSAIMLVYPSKYEGFGIPLVEAMACGCPVAASNVSSLPEVGADAAAYFDPENVDDMHDVIRHLLDNSHVRAVLADKGMIRAKDFSWDRTASETFETYKTLL